MRLNWRAKPICIGARRSPTLTEEQIMAEIPENSALEFLPHVKRLLWQRQVRTVRRMQVMRPSCNARRGLYVYTSTRSKHTKNMTETTRASVMFIEDETRTRNFFARERFTCECRAEVVDRESKEWRTVMSLFKKKFGRVFAMIPSTTGFYVVSPHSKRWALCSWFWAGIRDQCRHEEFRARSRRPSWYEND